MTTTDDPANSHIILKSTMMARRLMNQRYCAMLQLRGSDKMYSH